MLPRIEAQETLAAINVAALAAGAGEPLDRQRIFAELQRKASGEKSAKPASDDDLGAMGIGMEFSDEDQEHIGSLDEFLGLNPASEASEEGVTHG